MREFYNGGVQVFLVDHLDPACCSSGVAIVLPEMRTEPGGEKKCFSIHNLTGADVANARASYDANKGLLLTIPLRQYDPEKGHTEPAAPLRVRVNAKDATVKIEN